MLITLVSGKRIDLSVCFNSELYVYVHNFKNIINSIIIVVRHSTDIIYILLSLCKICIFEHHKIRGFMKKPK